MNVYESEIIIAASTVVAFTAVAVAYLLNAARNHRKRTSELKVVKTALEQHFRSVEILIDDPAVSDQLKMTLLTFSEAISNREVARHFASEISSDKLFARGKPNGGNDLAEEVNRLAKSRPDLAAEILKAVKSGLVALVLRWPETAKSFNQLVAGTLDDRREAVAFARVSQFAAKFFGGDNNMPTGGTAPAH